MAGAGWRPGPLPGGRRGSSTDHGWATEGSVQAPGVRADSLRTSGARARARRLPRAEDKVRARRPCSLGTGHRAPGASGARRAGPARGSDPAPDPASTPDSAFREPGAHSPLWLTQGRARSHPQTRKGGRRATCKELGACPRGAGAYWAGPRRGRSRFSPALSSRNAGTRSDGKAGTLRGALRAGPPRGARPEAAG